MFFVAGPVWVGGGGAGGAKLIRIAIWFGKVVREFLVACLRL